MKRIKIDDLPKDMKISPEELKQVRGGIGFSSFGRKATPGSFAWGGQSGFGGYNLRTVKKVPALRTWLNQGDIWMG